MSDFACHVLMGGANQCDKFLKRVMSQKLPKRLSVQAVESFFVIHKVDLEGTIPFDGLLYDNS